MDIVESTRDKLEQYGIQIYTDYPLNKKEHLFMVDNMLLFVHTKDKEIGISFQAETKPQTAAKYTLIVQEIDGIGEIDIMESFVVDENNKFISGEKAFKLIDKKNQYEAMNEIFKDQAYAEILMKGTIGEC